MLFQGVLNPRRSGLLLHETLKSQPLSNGIKS